MTKTKPKQKKCKDCKEEFKPFTTLQVRCVQCSITHGQGLQRKEFKAKKKANNKAKREFNNNDRGYLLEKAQKACNAYIRERDKHLPCISCGTTKPDIQYCAGHFKTRGAHPALRFNELNIHKQCNKHCNLSLSGNIANYRPRLIERIGIAKVEWLESYHPPQNLTLDEIKDITAHYREKLKGL
jgi:hypothetical protein